MRTITFFSFLIFWGMACQQSPEPEASPDAASTRFAYASFEDSRYIDRKDYIVCLPASYQTDTTRRYPVLYMMDAQNLFVDSLAYGGHSWRAHRVLDSLTVAGRVPETIIVGVNHAAEKRFSEYMPQKVAEHFPQSLRDSLANRITHPVYSDDFLAFLTRELKPHMDAAYRTRPDSAHTFIGGSSMGGLISMYALCEYPEVFAGAMCLSTHWPVSLDNSTPEVGQHWVTYLSENLPSGKRWYFDYGTEGLDRFYEPYQLRVDSVLVEKGYQQRENWWTYKYTGHDHNEHFWNQRLHRPFQLILGAPASR